LPPLLRRLCPLHRRPAPPLYTVPSPRRRSRHPRHPRPRQRQGPPLRLGPGAAQLSPRLGRLCPAGPARPLGHESQPA
ncbi:hypothetical protein BN1723_020817, partial [Verticillium longisporum]